MAPTTPMPVTPRSQRPPDAVTAAHHQRWNDELQEWLDDATPADTQPFASHLRDCDLCPQQLDRFRTLENVLRTHAPPLSLDESFDAQLLSRIQAINPDQHLAARQRIEQELLNGLNALSRSRRRVLAFAASGMAAAGAVAFALATHFSAAGPARASLSELVSRGTHALSQGDPMLLSSIVTALLGAGIGGIIAGWLAKSTA